MLDMALQTCIRDVTAVGHGKALQLNGRMIFEPKIGETEPNRKNRNVPKSIFSLLPF